MSLTLNRVPRCFFGCRAPPLRKSCRENMPCGRGIRNACCHRVHVVNFTDNWKGLYGMFAAEGRFRLSVQTRGPEATNSTATKRNMW